MKRARFAAPSPANNSPLPDGRSGLTRVGDALHIPYATYVNMRQPDASAVAAGNVCPAYTPTCNVAIVPSINGSMTPRGKNDAYRQYKAMFDTSFAAVNTGSDENGGASDTACVNGLANMAKPNPAAALALDAQKYASASNISSFISHALRKE